MNGIFGAAAPNVAGPAPGQGRSLKTRFPDGPAAAAARIPARMWFFFIR